MSYLLSTFVPLSYVKGKKKQKRVEGTFDYYSFSSHASFTGPFVSAKLSLFAKLCQNSGLALLAKCSLIPNLFSAFASVSLLFSQKAEIKQNNNQKPVDLFLDANSAFFSP